MKVRNLTYTVTALVFTTLLLFAVMLTFFARPLLMFSINLFLVDSNIAIASLEELNFNSQELSVARIEFTELNSQNQGSITDFVVTYSLPGLFEGKIGHLGINTLSFNWQAKDEASTEQSSNGQVSPLVMLASLRTLPLESLAIKQVHIPPFLESASIYVEKNAREVKAALSSDGNTVEAQINWHNDQYTSSYFIPDTDMTTQDFSAPLASGSLTIEHQREASGLVSFTLSELTGKLTAELDAEVNLRSINALLLEFGVWPVSTMAMDGQAHLTMTAIDEGTTSNDYHLSLEGEASIDATLRYLDASGSSTTLTLLTEPPVLAFQADYVDDQLNFATTTRNTSIGIASEFDSAPLRAQVDIETLTLSCDASTHCRASIASTTHIDDLSLQGVTAQGLTLTSNFAIEGSANDTSIRIESGTRFSADTLSANGAVSDDSMVEVMAPVLVRIHNSQTIDLDDGALHIHLPRVSTNDTHALLTLQIDKLKGSLDLQDSQTATLNAEILLSELQSDIMPALLPKASASLSIDANKASGTGTLFIAGQPVINVTAEHDAQNNQGEASFALSVIDLRTPSSAVTATLSLLPFNLALASGTVQGDAKIQWELRDEQWWYGGPARLAIGQLSGYLENTTFISVSTELLTQVSTGPTVQSTAPLTLTIEQIDPGIPVSDIHASYQFDTQDTTLALADISARIFNGTVSTPAVLHDWSNPDTRVSLTLERVDLARVLQLGAYEGVKATGLISGEVPLRYHAGAVSVTNGKLQAEFPGGSIRYSALGGQSGNASLDLVNQALSNYQYNVMETAASYGEDGELSLAVKLQGQNPDMNAGQKINLNLTITDNIPKLLESLQSSRNITDALERALNER